MSKLICLSGWGQKFDSLEFIFSNPIFAPFFLPEIHSIDYSRFNSAEEFFSVATSEKLSAEILVGWSLGGQLALRLIEKKIIQPRLLILIAPPFQMIKDARIQAGMSQNTFAEFYKNFSTAPSKTLKQFAILTAMNDRQSNEIARTLDVNEHNFVQLKFWLEELSRFSCFDLDFSQMPRTVFFQGAGDMIVHPAQAEYFRNRIANFRLEIFKNCGHAPHLSDIEKFREILSEELSLFEKGSLDFASIADSFQ